MKNSYIVGLMFSLDKTKVVLIQKNRPEFQVGKLNGVGGKKEKEDLNLYYTTVREFKEETGVETDVNHWSKIITLTNPNDETITFFKSFHKDFDKVKTMTDEKVAIVTVEGILRHLIGQDCKMLVVNNGKEQPDEIDFKIMDNIPWIVLLALDKDIYKAEAQSLV